MPQLKLTDAQRDLAARYVPLARALARPFQAQLPEIWEEFESAALAALVLAAARYDPERATFGTYARQRVWGALRDARRDHLSRRAMERPATDIEPEGLALVELRAADAPPVGSALDAAEAIEARLRTLPPGHAAACRLIYRDGLTDAEAARALGYRSRASVCRLHAEALAMFAGDGPAPAAAPRRPRGRPRKDLAPCPPAAT
ncbi:sigma factor [Tautonia plasticadhaerens]|uniref:Flagellar biosynthesis sigma factor n=1 Tax=Tautonia plasticadhaerens TaxID=2527974 RepID=A0A518GZL7_9BACT|nr:sigma factor [Tautonia plasticadhaerens]QDV34039.1 flagellar biosynthesis sigma factor [Tautonia plasticadhaerens]